MVEYIYANINMIHVASVQHITRRSLEFLGALGIQMLEYTVNEDRLSQRIRKFREDAGLSLRDLAELCSGNVSASTISRMENKQAKSYSDLQTLLPVLGVCGIDIAEIIESHDPAGRAQIDDISTQLRASKNVSTATLQALEAIIRAIQANDA